MDNTPSPGIDEEAEVDQKIMRMREEAVGHMKGKEVNLVDMSVVDHVIEGSTGADHEIDMAVGLETERGNGIAVDLEIDTEIEAGPEIEIDTIETEIETDTHIETEVETEIVGGVTVETGTGTVVIGDMKEIPVDDKIVPEEEVLIGMTQKIDKEGDLVIMKRLQRTG